jgi:putative FmdB family regulatory protein
MPTYEYECQKCGHSFEVMQSFSDAPVSKCTECRGKVRKLFSPPAIIFKGKGFHCTDYKSKGGPRSTPCGESAGEAKPDSPCEKAADECKGKCAAAS